MSFRDILRKKVLLEIIGRKEDMTDKEIDACVQSIKDNCMMIADSGGFEYVFEKTLTRRFDKQSPHKTIPWEKVVEKLVAEELTIEQITNYKQNGYRVSWS